MQRLISYWVYGAALAAVLLLALAPLLLAGRSPPFAASFLLLPAYMLHQYEEHDRDRFRLFFNATIGQGAEVLSPLIDWTDRNTCVLFGDGAGAMVLAPSNGNGRFISAQLKSDGTKHDQITFLGGLIENPASHETIDQKKHYVAMKGNDVFKFVNRVIPPFLKTLCEDAGMLPEGIDWWFFHQANQRIIERTAERLGINPERVFINLDEYGNTSAASVFIALSEFMKQGKLLRGQKLLFTAFGAGMTYGGVIYES